MQKAVLHSSYWRTSSLFEKWFFFFLQCSSLNLYRSSRGKWVGEEKGRHKDAHLNYCQPLGAFSSITKSHPFTQLWQRWEIWKHMQITLHLHPLKKHFTLPEWCKKNCSANKSRSNICTAEFRYRYLPFDQLSLWKMYWIRQFHSIYREVLEGSGFQPFWSAEP